MVPKTPATTEYKLVTVADYEPLIAAAAVVRLVKDPSLRAALGARARDAVRRNFLLTRLLEEWLDLFGAFEANFRLRGIPQQVIGSR
jgi:glycosyltransferase involved in cell wall biosynthesis